MILVSFLILTRSIYHLFNCKVVVGEYLDNNSKAHPIKREPRFIDSFKFMPASLDPLLQNLKEHHDFNKFYSGELLKLLLKKGIYPYEYVDPLETFKETCLPPKEAFYSKLYESDITDDEYEHAKNVWKVFDITTFRDYHDLYNMADVIQSADNLENVRELRIN